MRDIGCMRVLLGCILPTIVKKALAAHIAFVRVFLKTRSPDARLRQKAIQIKGTRTAFS